MNRKTGQNVVSESQGRKVALFTLGCKINQYDTNRVIAGLREHGHTCVSNITEADAIIINTCTVTGRTDYKGRQQIRKFIHQNPKAVVIVTGCYAQVQARAIAEIPGVDYVLGNTEKPQIPSLIVDCSKQDRPMIRVGNVLDEHTLDPDPLPVHSGTTRAFLKIQDGCDYACSYCIIPRARGSSRSLHPSVIREKILSLAKNKFEETVLCGIHLGLYGQDLVPPSTLRDLLHGLEEDAVLPRIRISSIEPNELSDELVSLFSGARNLCQHFHLPLQSGDARILGSMNRMYRPSDFISLVRKIRVHMPDAAIGVDLIAGFPGEGEREFENTLELLHALPVSYFHVFPYSPRPGTPASELPDPVAPELIHKRAGKLRELGREKRMFFYRRFLNRELEVLVETKRDTETGLLKGISRNYIPVLFEGPERMQRKRVHLKILQVNETGMVTGACTGPADMHAPDDILTFMPEPIK